MRIFYFVLTFLYVFTVHALAEDITVKDVLGRQVTVPRKIERTLALGPGTLRMLVYAGVQDTVVGRELFEGQLNKSFRPYTYVLSESYSSLPIVSSGKVGQRPALDIVRALKPDVIFSIGLKPEQMDEITEATAIPVVGLAYGETGHMDMGKVKESIRLLGYVMNTQKLTQDILNKMAMIRKDLMERVEGIETKSAYMASIAFKGARDFTGTESNHQALDLLNIENIADGAVSEPNLGKKSVVPMETIIEKQPDYIFFDVTGLKLLKKDYDTFYPSLIKMNAVREGRMFTVLPYNWYNSNVENIFLTAYFIGKTVYPEQFADVDISRKADEIFNTFLHMDPFPDIEDNCWAYKQVITTEKGLIFK